MAEPSQGVHAASAEANRRAGIPRSAPVLVVGALMLVEVAMAPWAVVLTDTARDLLEASALLAGDWPWRGPLLGNTFQLGPWWYVLVALPWGATGSVTATLVFLSALATLKYPLACAFGRRLVDTRLGLAFAAAMAIPGMGSLARHDLTHTCMVEAATLAVGYVLLRLAQGGSMAWWVVVGAAYAGALHAHPATLVLAPLALWPLRARGLRRSEAAAIAAGIGVLLLSLAPMLLAEAAEGWPAWQRLLQYGAGQGERIDPAAIVQLLALLPLNGPMLLARHLAPGTLGPALYAAYALITVAALAGVAAAMRPPGWRRRWLLASFALALAAAVLVATMRASTPFYMLLVLRPFAALALALALHALFDAGAPARRLAVAALVACAGLSIAFSALWILRAEQGLVQLPVQAIGDARRPALSATEAALAPPWRLESVATAWCGGPEPVVLHAQLAQMIGIGVGTHLPRGCAAEPLLTGAAQLPTAQHRLGLVPALLQRLGFDAGWRDALALRPTRVAGGGPGFTVPDDAPYPYYALDPGPVQRQVFAFTAGAADLVIVATPFDVFDGATRIVAVEAEAGQPRQLSDLRSLQVWACHACDAPVRWKVAIDTPYPERVEVIVWRPPGKGPAR